MVDSRRDGPSGGLYERLLQRLAIAMDEADGLSVLSDQPLLEMELRGLTAAEMELIRAYLNHDLDWLRGWHAAAQEMAQIEQLPSARKAMRGTSRHVSPMPGKVKPLLKRRLQLACAMCGAPAGWHSGRGVKACHVCGSQLFRASNPR